ncbi:MAG: response regulator [bacterium]
MVEHTGDIIHRIDFVEHADFTDFEREALWFDHAEAGGELAKRWIIPESLIIGIQNHHHPYKAPEKYRALLYTLHLADSVGGVWDRVRISFLYVGRWVPSLLPTQQPGHLGVDPCGTGKVLEGGAFAFQLDRTGEMVKTVFIVDDSATARMMIRRWVEIAGLPDFAFVEAGNGHQGLDTLKETNVDLIFTDLNMPEMDEKEFLHRVRLLEGYSVVPDVVITSTGNEAKKAVFRKQGSSFILSKPISPAIMADTLQRLEV